MPQYDAVVSVLNESPQHDHHEYRGWLRRLWDSIGLALDPEVLIYGHPFPLEVEQFTEVLYPTPVILPARVARLSQGAHSWCGTHHRDPSPLTSGLT